MNSSLFEGKFGLERETLRVDKNGRLAQTLHPFEDEHLSRDFCENQLEIITPVCNSIEEMMRTLKRLDSEARAVLRKQDESLWIYSNPPHIDSESEIPIARYSGDLSAKHDYRISLARRYGKRMMLYSGIHFNFSFSEDHLHELYDRQTEHSTYEEFKNAAYFRLLKQVSRYSWLLVMLTAASPLYDLSFDEDNADGPAFDGYASMRNSERGYWNQFIPQLDYSGLTDYVKSVQNYIHKGVLLSAGELYLPVRLKPRGENSLESLLKNGVDHIELRMFDLNPLEPLGVSQKDLEFAHLFLIYLLHRSDFDFTPEMQEQAILNHQSAALYELDEIRIGDKNIKSAANQFFDDMEDFFSDDPEVETVIEYERSKLSGNRICETIRKMAGSDVYV